MYLIFIHSCAISRLKLTISILSIDLIIENFLILSIEKIVEEPIYKLMKKVKKVLIEDASLV